MPNDPRVKFKKRIYDMCYNLFEERTGGGGGSYPSGGGGGGGGGIPWTPVGPSIPVKPPIPTPSITPFNPYLGFQPFVSPNDITGRRLRGTIDEMDARNRAKIVPMPQDDILNDILVDDATADIKPARPNVDDIFGQSTPLDVAAGGKGKAPPKFTIKPVDLTNPPPPKIPKTLVSPTAIDPNAQGTPRQQLEYLNQQKQIADGKTAISQSLEKASPLEARIAAKMYEMKMGGATEEAMNAMAKQMREQRGRFLDFLNKPESASTSASSSAKSTPERSFIETNIEMINDELKNPTLSKQEVIEFNKMKSDYQNQLKMLADEKAATTLKDTAAKLELQKTADLEAAAKSLNITKADLAKAIKIRDSLIKENDTLKFINEELAKPKSAGEVKILKQQKINTEKNIAKIIKEGEAHATKVDTKLTKIENIVTKEVGKLTQGKSISDKISEKVFGKKAVVETPKISRALVPKPAPAPAPAPAQPRPREGSLTTQTLEDSLELDRQIAEMRARQSAQRSTARPEATEAEAAGVGIDFTQPSAGEQAARARGYLNDAPTEGEMVEIGSLTAQNHITEFNEYYDTFINDDLFEAGFKMPDIPENVRTAGDLATKKYVLENAIDFVNEPGRPGIAQVAIRNGEKVLTGKKLSKQRVLNNMENRYQRAQAQQDALPPSRTPSAREVRAPPGEAPSLPPTPPEFELHGLDTPGASSGESSGTTSRGSGRSMESQPTGRDLMSRLNRANYDRVDILDTIDDLGGNIERGGRVATSEIELEDLGGNIERGGRVTTTEPADVAPTRPTQPTQPKAPRGLEAMELETVDLAPPRPSGRGRAKIEPKPKAKPTPRATQKFGGSIQELTFNKMVSSEFTNNAKTFANSLRGLGNRIPVLKAPSVNTIKRYGGEVGGTLGGVAIGIGISYLMAQYFKQHPATDIYSQIGQQYAVGLAGVAGASIIMKAIQIAGRLGARKMASTAGAKMLLYESVAATGEGAVLVAAQMAVEIGTEALMDRYKYNHEQSKAVAAAAGSVVNIGYGAARGGPAGAVLMALFSVYSITEATLTGQQEDRDELENRQKTADTSNRVNNARRQLVINMGNTNNDINKAYMLLTPKQRSDYNLVGASEVSNFENSLRVEFDPLEKEKNGNPYAPKPVEEDTQLADAFFSGVEVMAPFSPAAALLNMKEHSFQENEAREQKLKDKYYTDYINWYLNKKNEVIASPPPPEDEGFRLLERDTLGSWRQSAEFSAELSYRQTVNYNRVVNNARNQILDEWHASTTTMQEIAARDDNGRRLAETAALDTSFVYDYEKYIVQDAAIQLTQQFNNNGTNYRDADPKLVAIAGRDQDVLAGLDHYYEVMTTLSKDTGLSIAELARLNALPVNEQERELGKINSLRERVIRGGLLQDKALVDEFNANLIKEMQSYGENFEAIMLNINENQMLNGYSYLYGTNKSDLYRQLHLEAPVLVIENPYAGSTEFDRDKNRTPGDTLIYGYRYNLTDSQNQELEEYLYDKNRALYQKGDTKGRLTTEDAMAKAAEIYARDIDIYRKSDEEVAKDNNMTLDEYYAEYGYDTDKKPPVEPIEWKDITERPDPPPMHSSSNIESDDRAGERQANAELQARRVAGGGSSDEFDRMATGAYDAAQRARVDAEGGNNIEGNQPRTNANGEIIRQENDPDGP